MDRTQELRELYDNLKRQLAQAEGSGAAALSRELRIIGKELEQLESEGKEVPLVDQLAERRAQARGGSASTRRKSG